MIALRLVRLIEDHSETLAQGLMRKLYACDKCRGFHKVPQNEIEERSREVYKNLSDWLVQKTETDIEREYRRLGRRRAEQGIPFTGMYWALIVTKEHLWDFLIHEGIEETPLDLRAGFELVRLIEQFFERAIYYAALEYEQVGRVEHGTRAESAHAL